MRSCVKQSKKELVIKQLKKYRIQIAALSETCIYDCSVKLINDYTMIYSGVPSDNKTRNAHGVAICFDQTAMKVWKDSGSEWEAVSEWIVKIRLKCSQINMTVVAVYSPVNPSNKQAADISDKFYNDLQDALNKVSTDDMIIIMWDLNARVGNMQPQETASNSIGPFTVDSTNENVFKLIDFCTINNLIISNTFFEHKTVHQMSWMHPGNKTWHIIDYTLVNKKFRPSVEDVRMFRRASGVVGTDHHLMRAKITLHLRSRRKVMVQKRLKYNSTKFKNEQAVKAFQNDLCEILNDAYNNSISLDAKYSAFMEHLEEHVEKHFKLDKGSNTKRKEWFTDEILKIVDQKSLAFINWQNHCGTALETEYRNKYKRLRKLAKTKIKARQTEYWNEVCEGIENSIRLNNPSTAFSIVRCLRGESKRVENMPIKDKSGKLLLNSADRLERWRGYFNELFNVPSVFDWNLINEIHIDTISKDEEEQQNALPSIEETRRALSQLKSRKAPGSDEITADILKAGGAPVIQWLHEIFTGVWENEQNNDRLESGHSH